MGRYGRWSPCPSTRPSGQNRALRDALRRGSRQTMTSSPDEEVLTWAGERNGVSQKFPGSFVEHCLSLFSVQKVKNTQFTTRKRPEALDLANRSKTCKPIFPQICSLGSKFENDSSWHSPNVLILPISQCGGFLVQPFRGNSIPVFTDLRRGGLYRTVLEKLG